MIIKRKKRFLKSYKKLDRKIQDIFDSKIYLFAQNPFDISLKNHSLAGEYEGFRSINITGYHRTIFKEFPD